MPDPGRCSSELCAFMLVCELGKLSAAAKAMNISQPSLSQRIKNLETTLNRQLFTRHSTGVDLTHHGKTLLRLLGQPMQQTATRLQDYLTTAVTDRVVISVDNAFASFWLLPRLPQLREELGSTDICILSSQDSVANATPETDISIFMASARDARSGLTRLLQEQVSAVCSAAFLANNEHLKNPQALLGKKSRLLHLNAPSKNTPWLDWSQWLARLQVPSDQIPAEIVFNSYEMIIKAARQGQGVALGWHGLIDELLAESELVLLFPDTVTTEVGYYIESTGISKSSKTRLVQEWVIDTMGANSPLPRKLHERPHEKP